MAFSTGMGRARLGISSCLLGYNHRSDGVHKRRRVVDGEFSERFDLVPVCPEVGAGMPIPYKACTLVGESDKTRIFELDFSIDRSNQEMGWDEGKLQELKTDPLNGLLFKSRSPSCSLHGFLIRLEGSGEPLEGRVIFCREFKKVFPNCVVTDESTIESPIKLEAFITELGTPSAGDGKGCT